MDGTLILMDSRHMSNLVDVIAFRDVGIDSDHFLVVNEYKVEYLMLKK